MIRRYIKSYSFKTVVLAALLLTACSPSFAGTICGTVRDMDTDGPVARAGVFVRTQEGEYTGYHGATSEAGTFCIDEIPAGTYDLEIAVDDYETRYIRGVEVTDETTDVDIGIFESEHFLYAPWPNPAQTSVTFRYRVGDPAPVKLQIYDVTDGSYAAGRRYPPPPACTSSTGTCAAKTGPAWPPESISRDSRREA